MKKLLLPALLFVAISSVNAQDFLIFPEVSHNSGPSSEFELISNVYVKNNTDLDTVFVWQRTQHDFPAEWTSSICDEMTCYDWRLDTYTFRLGPGDSSKLDVHFYPANTKGEGSVTLKVYMEGDSSNYVSGTYYLSTWGLSANGSQLISNDISFYPNPVKDQLNIELNAPKPVTIEVYNILGKKVMDHVHEGKTSVMNVENLLSGVYFIRYTDTNGKVISKTFKKIG